MFKLRDYQQDVRGGILAAWQRVQAVLGLLSTGGGKTVIFSAVLREHGGACAAVVHRREILSQISCSLGALDIKHRVIAPPETVALIRRKQLKRFGKSFIDPHARCGVISVQTVTSKSAEKNVALKRWLDQITLCVFDEGHHYVKQGIWGRAVERMGHAKLLFATACAERADGKGLGRHADGYCDTIVEGPPTQWLIDQGYLSPFRYITPETDLNVADLVATASGDVGRKAMRERVVKSHLVGDVVDHYMRYAPGKKTIVFVESVETAQEVAQRFTDRGVSAAAMHGGTDTTERERGLEDFEFGDLDVLVNVGLFDEGFDVPGVECVILAVITLSLNKFLQMCGRGLRPVYAKRRDLSTQAGRLAAIANGAKPKAIIIDPVRNWERHQLPNWPRLWSLDGRMRNTRDTPSDTIPLRACLECTQPYERFYSACPHCGAAAPEPAGRSAPEQVDGDLAELDVEGLAELLRKIQHADMNDEDYALDQIARNVPPVGRAQDARRYRAARYRRAVLKELIAWWVGMQPNDRPLSEKQRRFNYRFGVDMGTALTLNEKDTDALIALIQERFGEDIAA